MRRKHLRPTLGFGEHLIVSTDNLSVYFKSFWEFYNKKEEENQLIHAP